MTKASAWKLRLSLIGARSVAIMSSEAPYMTETTDIYKEVLDSGGIAVVDMGQHQELRAPDGLMKYLESQGMPYGTGKDAMRHWRLNTRQLPAGVETFSQTAVRVANLLSYSTHFNHLLVLTHGGVTESHIYISTGGQVELQAIPTAGLVVWTENLIGVFDPKTNKTTEYRPR